VTKKQSGRMYKDTKAWNPFVGCEYQCTYCKPSYQKVVAWNGRMRGCDECQTYTPHEHEERLSRIPREKTIFVCSNGDISFARKGFMEKVFEAMRLDKRKDRIWLVQSKAPSCFQKYLSFLPRNTYLLTTLETNRDEGYDKISQAPKPSKRYKDFLSLKWDNKIVTVEPIMDFDLDPFVKWIKTIEPSVVFIGNNSHQKRVPIPEPTWDKFLTLWRLLRRNGIRVLPKETRRDYIPKVAYKDYFD